MTTSYQEIYFNEKKETFSINDFRFSIKFNNTISIFRTSFRNSSVVYYRLIRNTRISPKNNFVVDETNYTTFYLDSTHKYSLGSTYVEYIF